MLDYMSIPDFQYEKALINACRIISDAKLYRICELPKSHYTASGIHSD